MTVFIVKEKSDLNGAISQIIDTFKDGIDFNKGIFIKPNIVFPVKDASGIITRRCVVAALIDVLRKKKPDIDIVIGEGTAAGSIPEENFKISGYSEMAKSLAVPLIDLNKAERVKVDWHYGKLSIPKMAFERTYINLPILKKSTAAGISGASKNQKGLLTPGVKKGFHRMGLHEPIAYLNQAVQPSITILDGKNFFNENIFFAGDNTGEIDLFVSKRLCADTPDHIKIAQDIGLISNDYGITGDSIDDIENVKIENPKKTKNLFNIRLISNPRACSMCRYLFQDIKKISRGDFRYQLGMWFKLLKYSIIGADIVYGTKAIIPDDAKRVICVGNCNKKLAKDMGYRFVPGCPPTKEDMLKFF